MNTFKYIIALISLLVLQQQCASEMVKIQPKEFSNTDNFIEVSIDHPAITESEMLQSMIGDVKPTGDFIEIKILFSSTEFDRYKNFMLHGWNEESFDVKDFKDLNLLEKINFFEMLDYFLVTQFYSEEFFDKAMPILVEEISDYFERNRKEPKKYAQVVSKLHSFLQNRISRNALRENRFTQKFKQEILLLHDEDIKSLKRSSLWQWIISEYGSDVARISFTEFERHFPEEFAQLVDHPFDEMLSAGGFYTITVTDLPFVLYFEKDFPHLRNVRIKLDSSYAKKQMTFSLEEQLNSIFISSDSVQFITNLRLVNLGLQRLPESIGNLINVRLLILDQNKLEYVPESIGTLVYLETLSLDGNRLTEFPSNVLLLANLKYLNIMRNNISMLPSVIINLTELKRLLLFGNPIDFESEEFLNIRQALEDQGTIVQIEKGQY